MNNSADCSLGVRTAIGDRMGMKEMRERRLANRCGMIAATVLTLSFAPAAKAADWIFGAGVTDFSGSDESVLGFLSVEVHSRPIAETGRLQFSTVAGGSVDHQGDIWVGVGLAALFDADAWFIEASLMPGYYNEASTETDLGSSVQFRSLIGVGYTFSPTTRVSIAIDHRSNAGIGERNPGANTVSLRLRKSF